MTREAERTTCTVSTAILLSTEPWTSFVRIEASDTCTDGTLSRSADNDMAGRHRARFRSIQIIRTATVKASATKRPQVQQMHVRDTLVPCSCGRLDLNCTTRRTPRSNSLSRTAFSEHLRGNSVALSSQKGPTLSMAKRDRSKQLTRSGLRWT
jgi:hypothetical protein